MNLIIQFENVDKIFIFSLYYVSNCSQTHKALISKIFRKKRSTTQSPFKTYKFNLSMIFLVAVACKCSD